MCGFVGYLRVANQQEPSLLTRRLHEAALRQRHRGPDGEGFLERRVGAFDIGFAHQRLAILDLSSAGAQPMWSRSGKSCIVYNGEIYNYLELAAELKSEGLTLHSHSDSEVLVEALEHWGERAFEKLNGMWSFAWLNIATEQLTLSRDRVGVKPLYYILDESGLSFASEIKSLPIMHGKTLHVNERVVADYLGNWVLEARPEDTFFREVRKVLPSSYQTYSLKVGPIRGVASRFWSLQRSVLPSGLNVDSAPAVLRDLLADSVRLRLRSDVPIGILLSGGVDSGAIASLMRREMGPRHSIVALSATSDDKTTDESRFIDCMARHVRADVIRVHLAFSAEKAMNLLADVCRQNDEPAGGFSVVALKLLMEQAKIAGLKVVLGGQGADEAFCGYRKYLFLYLQSLIRTGRIAEATRVASGFVFRGTVLPDLTLAHARRYLPRLRSSAADIRGPSLRQFSESDLHLGLAPGQTVNSRQQADVEQFSLPSLTHYEDRLSMAASVEVRDPFLDYRVLTFGVRAPMAWKINSGWTKFILRRALSPLMPPEVVWRRDKKGFETPEDSWLRGPLGCHAHALLGPKSEVVRRGYVDNDRMQSVFRRFLANDGVSSQSILAPLTTELWLQAFADVLE